MPRRSATVVLALAFAGCAAGPRPASEPGAGVRAGRELTPDEQAAQAVNRLTFGPRPGEVARVRATGVDRWIEQQLHPERIADPSAGALAASFALVARPAADLLAAYPPPAVLRARRAMAGGAPPAAADSATVLAARRAARRVPAQLAAAKVARAVASERQLQEVMVDFWENHFNVFVGKGPLVRYYLVDYDRDAIRPHALGRFRDLLGAVAHSPAMLLYLDNARSVADSAPRARPAGRRGGLNENYARELLELHTLGVDGGYTQADVRDVARAFTGWSVRPPAAGGGFVFRAAAHDAGPKTVLGERLPGGRGEEDGEAVLDLVARHPATARFIATKLARRLVSDTPPAALVARAAATFRRTDGDVRETVRTIVTSPEFFARRAYRAKVKSPFELVASTLRALGAAPDTTARTAQLVARLGQPLFGHQAPDGYPETGAPWMSAGAIVSRINFGLAAAAGRVPGLAGGPPPPLAAVRGAGREAQIAAVERLLLGGAASPETRAVLASGVHPLLPADAAAGRPSSGGLAAVLGLALGSPEFQRR